MAIEVLAEDREMLRKLEEELWRQETRFDVPYMKKVMSEDFIEFGRSGRIYDRSDCLDSPSQVIDAVLPLPDFTVRMITKNVAQVTYNSEVTYDGAVQYGRRSSIWVRSGASWVLKFHQGTPFEKDD